MIFVITQNKAHFDAFLSWMRKSSPRNREIANSCRWASSPTDLNRPNAEIITAGPYWKNPFWSAYERKILELSRNKFVAIQWFPLSGSPTALPE